MTIYAAMGRNRRVSGNKKGHTMYGGLFVLAKEDMIVSLDEEDESGL